MRASSVCPTVLSICIFICATTALPSPTDFAHGVSKRWFSIAGLWSDRKDVLQTWPVQVDAAGIRTQRIRLCYGKRSDYNTLHNIVEQAIKMWEPAGPPNSAMEFYPMNGKHENSICEGTFPPDTLNIRDTTTSKTAKITACSLGWNPMIMEDKRNDVKQSKYHTLDFARSGSQPNTNGEVVRVDPGDKVRMAHELGHALGLDHENQRHDADQYIKFNCQNLGDYNRVKDIIAAKDASEGYKDGDTIEKACTEESVANRYGFSASQHINEKEGMIGQKQRSKKFDFDSIMLYGSYDGSAAVLASNFPQGAVMVGKGDGKKKPDFRCWMGGKEPRQLTSVSEGDKARTAQLYPLVDGKGKAKVPKTKKDWEGVKVKVGGRA